MSFESSNNFGLENTGRDSGISSFSSDCNESSNSLIFNFGSGQDITVLANKDKNNVEMPKEIHTHKVRFLGEQQLSRRHTPYMIPWVVEEIKGNCEEYYVNVSVTNSAKNPDHIVLKVDYFLAYSIKPIAVNSRKV